MRRERTARVHRAGCAALFAAGSIHHNLCFSRGGARSEKTTEGRRETGLRKWRGRRRQGAFPHLGDGFTVG